jgi:hypothetical protein
MRRRDIWIPFLGTVAIGQEQRPGFQDTPPLPNQKWKVHDSNRPYPPVVTPGKSCGDAPSDAVVLFDGKDLSNWIQMGRGADRGKQIPPRWKVENGYLETGAKSGDLLSKEKFGDAQYHVEWASPNPPKGVDQDRGNSGFIIMSRYEIQVLDSYQSLTYADGQAGAIYGQWPPLVNPIRKVGEWNSYDIIFTAPRFESGKLTKPAYVTVLFNGVLVHHHQEIIGPMTYRGTRPYQAHGPEEPLLLQDHDHPVRYRNIWVRRLKGYDIG